MLLVERHVEQRAAVVGPGEAALGFPDAVGQQHAAGEILHSDAIALGAVAVDGVGKQPLVGHVRAGSDPEVTRALGLADRKTVVAGKGGSVGENFVGWLY